MLANLIGTRVKPNAIVTDRELALFTPIREIFPDSAHLLCTWHINRDVEGWVRKKTRQAGMATKFGRGSWSSLLHSATEEEYEEKKTQLLSKWYWVGYPQGELREALADLEAGSSKIGEYLDRTWLQHKEKFVKAWTIRVRHFGNTTNYCTESQHSYIKN